MRGNHEMSASFSALMLSVKEAARAAEATRQILRRQRRKRAPLRRYAVDVYDMTTVQLDGTVTGARELTHHVWAYTPQHARRLIASMPLVTVLAVRLAGPPRCA